MICINQKTQCCGCTACYNACPKDAIQMLPDEEGFLYPVVNEERCIDCGICEIICPINNKEKKQEETKGYILRNKDANIVKESTSGGAFTLFAEHLLQRGYTVYGAGYDTDMKVVCKAATSLDAIKEMRGSKFVQCYLGDTFKEIKEALNNGEKILFTGTPCQVEGLICFLKKKPENLICIDIVCRGVPSPKLWNNYVSMMERKFSSRMTGAWFKKKTYGYHSTTMNVVFENGKTWSGSGRVDPMMKAFVNEMASRPSCHHCSFKEVQRSSDITMFDCYEFSSITDKVDDDKGYSSLLVHSVQGLNLIRAISKKAIIYEVSVEKLVEKNGIMVEHSARANENRNQFYTLVSAMPIDEAMNIVSPITPLDKAVEASKVILYKSGLIRLARLLKKETIYTND